MRAGGKIMRYRIKAINILQKIKLSTLGMALVYIGIGLAILGTEINRKVFSTIYISLGVSIFMLFVADLFNFHKYEKFTICFINCIVAIDNILNNALRDKSKFTNRKYINLCEEFNSYYEEIILYTNSMNIEPDIIKDLINLKRSFDKFQNCESCDFKSVLCEIKVRFDCLKKNCFSTYGPIYEKNRHS